ncbi:PE-PPE domain-containing protein [Mycobacterium sp. C3-094]
MPALFEAVGAGGGPRTFDGQAGGAFTGTHPGADGPNGIVIVAVAGYRKAGKAVDIAVTYGDIPMTTCAQVWGNGVSNTTPRSGWLQYFYLLNPPADAQDWAVSWSSPLGAVDQIQMRATSLSYTGVSGVGDLAVVFGGAFTTAMEQVVDAPADSVILQGFLQEWFTPISNYNRPMRVRLDDVGTGRPYDTVIGDTAGGTVTFTGRRAVGSAWAGVALPLIASQSTVIAARPAELTITGYEPFDGNNRITARPARLLLAGAPGPARQCTRIQARPAELRLATYEPWSGLPVFPAATVLTLRGLNLFGSLNPNDMPQKFQGIFSAAPYDMHEVSYPASLDPKSIPRGVTALDAAITYYPKPIIVLAQSQGMQVASRWMDEHADDPDAPGGDELMFIGTGNPLRATGGAGIGVAEVDGHIGEPTRTDVRWLLIDVARRYDGWPDPVQDTTNTIASLNADRGRNSLHKRYDQVDLYDPDHTIWRVGSTIFVLTREDDLPYFKGSDQPESLVSATRAVCESAYTNRPPNDPPVPEVLAANTFERQLIARMLTTQ